MNREDWNRRYAGGDPHGTDAPSRFLVAEAGDLAPGRALDLGCGAGRNAVWLAERGWRVTAVDFADHALGMARALAAARGVDVHWIEADVVAWRPEPGGYDLVCVCYLQLPAAERRAVLAGAAAAVAPGGRLLVIGHDRLNLTEGVGGPRQPEVLYTPEEVSAELPGLTIEKAERVRRPVGEAGPAAVDTLVRARRA